MPLDDKEISSTFKVSFILIYKKINKPMEMCVGMCVICLIIIVLRKVLTEDRSNM